MAYDEFIASDRSLRSNPKLPAAEPAAAGSGCLRNPRAAGRSGCTPAEPYPPSRKIRVDQNVNFYNRAIDKPHTRNPRFQLPDSGAGNPAFAFSPTLNTKTKK